MKLNNEEIVIVKALLSYSLDTIEMLTDSVGPIKDNPKYSKTFKTFIKKLMNSYKSINHNKLGETIHTKEYMTDLEDFWKGKTKIHPNSNIIINKEK